ncbi:MAG TPA: DUF748 domain-containing protein [bacterium]|nr:DUF748 domain-containing protein [bacterium]
MLKRRNGEGEKRRKSPIHRLTDSPIPKHGACDLRLAAAAIIRVSNMAPLRKDLKSGKWYSVEEKRGRRKRKPKRRIRGLLTLVIILLLFVILFININPITSFTTEQIIIYQIEKRVTFKVSCENLKADIFTDRVIIEGVKMISSNQFGEEPFIYIPKIEFRLRYKLLLQRKIIMDDVIYYQPEVFSERNEEGKWNFPEKKKYKKKYWLFAQPKQVVKGGRITFKDGKISKEPLITELRDIDIEATDFSNRIPAGAKYTATGQIVSGGMKTPFWLEGSQDSFVKPLNFAFRLQFKDLDLLPFAPYQREITSSKLVRGRMDLETELQCEKNELDSMNRVIFKNLELQPLLGAEPSLVKVMGMGPAALATVLRDDQGRIRLDIPVRGDITDPDFKIGSALLKALIRAIQETIVGPFSSIAKLVFTKEGISEIYLLPIEFVRGSTKLAKGTITKLVDLSRLLIKYPTAPLHIEGYVDPLREKGLWRGTSLAYRRARKVADYLIKEAKIPEEKIKLSTKEEKKKKRVELRIEE